MGLDHDQCAVDAAQVKWQLLPGVAIHDEGLVLEDVIRVREILCKFVDLPGFDDIDGKIDPVDDPRLKRRIYLVVVDGCRRDRDRRCARATPVAPAPRAASGALSRRRRQ